MILTGESLRTEPYSMMLRKDDPQFKALVDGVIVTVWRPGAMPVLTWRLVSIAVSVESWQTSVVAAPPSTLTLYWAT